MPEAAPSALTAWSNFYVIIGSSAAALTGLMFVVITLVAGKPMRTSADGAGISTFSTPTVVHFSMALLVAALLSAPWRSPAHAGVMLGLAGLFGVAYVCRVAFRARELTVYRPMLEDWIWHTILPLLAYLTIVVSAFVLRVRPVETLFALAAATMLLIFIGIHNAWDVVTYIAVDRDDEPAPAAPSAAPPPAG